MKNVGDRHKLQPAVIFRKCLGLNDVKTYGTKKTDPETGETFLADCLNVTTSIDGAIEKIPGRSVVVTHTAPIVSISAEDRLLFADATDTNEWTGTAVFKQFPLQVGPVVHTPIDVRVSGAAANYKNKTSGVASTQATVGTNPDPATSVAWAAMPLVKSAFVYNAKMYGINRSDPRFLQYSKNYHYDLWNLGDDFIPFRKPILDAKFSYSQKPGTEGGIVLMFADGIGVLSGSGPEDFKPETYPCEPIVNTLASGWISKASNFAHVYITNDGIYSISDTGEVACLTLGAVENLKSLNTSYVGASIHNGKYIAVGNSVAIEYDFNTKAVMKRSSFGATSVTDWLNASYMSVGADLLRYTADIDSSTLTAMVEFPPAYMGMEGAKIVSDLYFSGRFDGDLLVTATDENGKSWEKEIPEMGTVSNRQVTTPRPVLGNHISIRIDSLGGAFRLEELRATVIESKRSR